MLFILMELDHGDVLGEFDTEAAALAALDRILAADADAASELGVVAYDETGEQVGEPITRAAA